MKNKMPKTILLLSVPPILILVAFLCVALYSGFDSALMLLVEFILFSLVSLFQLTQLFSDRLKKIIIIVKNSAFGLLMLIHALMFITQGPENGGAALNGIIVLFFFNFVIAGVLSVLEIRVLKKG